MLESLALWLHVTAATGWVGSQLMMFAVVVPALRPLPEETRLRVLEALTPRVGWFGYVALAVLTLTGIDNIRQYTPSYLWEVRYGYILTLKLAMLVVVLGLTILHTQVVGPALLRLQRRAIEAPGAGDAAAAVRAMRGRSIAISSVTLLLSLAILLCAVQLRSAFAHAQV